MLLRKVLELNLACFSTFSFQRMEAPEKKKLFLILDFEANCSGQNVRDHEILEFPAVLIDENGKQLAEFRRFVLPVKIERVSDFIRNLTGITDAVVRKHGVDWSVALAEFEAFCAEHCLGRDKVQRENGVLCCVS